MILSAVDANVRKAIFEKCIGPKGFVRDKTRILVTNTVSGVAKHADKILILDKTGRIVKSGSYEDVTHGEESVITTETKRNRASESAEKGQGEFIDDANEHNIYDITVPLMKPRGTRDGGSAIVVGESKKIGCHRISYYITTLNIVDNGVLFLCG